MGAAPIGRPGWPEFAFCTASMERQRMVFTHSWSSCGMIESGILTLGYGLAVQEISLLFELRPGGWRLCTAPATEDYNNHHITIRCSEPGYECHRPKYYLNSPGGVEGIGEIGKMWRRVYPAQWKLWPKAATIECRF